MRALTATSAIATSKPGGIVYWMSRDQRVQDNWALLFARQLSPAKRLPASVAVGAGPAAKGKDEQPVGVAGTCELLNSRVISTQPIVSFDWSPDREGLCVLSCLDQTLRVYICTKLNKI